MPLQLLVKFASFLLFLISSFSSFASYYEDYLVYKADVDGDGDVDYYLAPKPISVDIPYEIELTVASSGQVYLLKRNPDGSLGVSEWSGEFEGHLIDSEIEFLNFHSNSEKTLSIKTEDIYSEIILLALDNEHKIIIGNSFHVGETKEDIFYADVNEDGWDDIVSLGDNTISALSGGASPDSLLSNDQVHSLNPEAWVDQTGAARIRYDIELPSWPGPKPNLSLGYSSYGGNGSLGIGFSLLAGSKIHYCNPVADVDGRFFAPAFSARERLCVDGQLLVKSDDTHNDGSVYFKEINDGTRYVFQGSGIVAKAKNGLEYFYTLTRKESESSSNQTVEWHLESVKNSFGLGYSIYYKGYSGDDPSAYANSMTPLVEKVEYGDIEISFVWESRLGKESADPEFPDYVATAQDEAKSLKRRHYDRLIERLKSIEVKRDQNTIYEYELIYGVNSIGQSQLYKVEKCSKVNGLNCVESVIDWNEVTHQFQEPEKLATLSGSNGEQKINYLDVNGDGFKDIMYATTSEWKVRLGSETGFGPELDTGSSIGVGNYADYAVPFRLGQAGAQSLLVADIQVDGVKDYKYVCYWDVNDFYIYNGHQGPHPIKSSGECGGDPDNQGQYQRIPMYHWYVLQPIISEDRVSRVDVRRLFLPENQTHSTNHVGDVITMGNRVSVADINSDGLDDVIVDYESPLLDYLNRVACAADPSVCSSNQDYYKKNLVLYIAYQKSNGPILPPTIEYKRRILYAGSDSGFLGSVNVADVDADGDLDIEKCPLYDKSQRCLQFTFSFVMASSQNKADCIANPSCDIGTYDALLSVGEVRRFRDVNPDQATKEIEYEGTFSDEGSGTKSLISPNYYADFNGDGVTDLMQIENGGSVKMLLNQGKLGVSQQLVNSPIIDGDPFKVRLVDYNQDGLLDIFAEKLVSGEPTLVLYEAVRPSAGTRTVESDAQTMKYVEVDIFSGSNIQSRSYSGVTFYDTKTYFYDTSNGYVDHFRHRPVIQYREGPTPLDYDGDGVFDLIYRDGDDLYVTKRESAYPYSRKIASVQNSFGVKTQFQYKNSRLKPNTDNDGVGFPYVNIANTSSFVWRLVRGNDDVGYRTFQYDFYGGQAHLQGRGFLGYSYMAVLDLDKNKIDVKSFEQRVPLTGRMTGHQTIYVQEDSSTVSTRINTLNWKALTASKFSNFVYTPYLMTTSEQLFGLDNGVQYGRITSRNTIDQLGNSLIFEKKFYEGDGETLIKEEKITNEFSHVTHGGVWDEGELDLWRIGFKTGIKVEKSASDFSSIVETSITPYQQSNKPHVVTEFKGSHQELVSTYGYHTNGVVKSHELSSGGNAKFSIASRKVLDHQAFENDFWPTTTRDPNGNAMTYSYDGIWKKPSSFTDSLGLTTEYSYGSWGQESVVKSPDGTIDLTLSTYCGDDSKRKQNCPDNAYFYSTQLKMHKSNKGLLAPPKYTYFDALGRTVMKESRLIDGTAIFTTKEYDALGREFKVSQPFKDGQTPYFSVKTYYQDNQVKSVATPDSGLINYSYVTTPSFIESIESNNFSKQDEDGVYQRELTDVQVNKSKTNLLGWIVETEQANGLKTQYEYDANDKLRKSANIDLNGESLKIVTADYDQAGNKIKVIDPDSGSYEFEFDPLKLVRREVTPLVSEMFYSYDRLNQKRKHFIGDELISTWNFDDQKPGLLKSRIKGEFEELFEYDSLYRLSSVKTKIKELPARLTKFEYDYASRQVAKEYPSGFKVNNVYGSYGMLAAYQDSKTKELLWSGSEMGVYGNWISQEFGNGVTTNKGFDLASGLISTIQTSDADSNVLQNLSYRWDSNGALISRSKDNIRESFVYDNVNRLVQADTVGLVGGDRTLDYDYDLLGNMTYKSDLSDIGGMKYGYSNGTTGPSRLTSIHKGGSEVMSLHYDIAGNVKRKGETNFSYTSANKPFRIWTGTVGIGFHENYFEYDTDEQRYYQRQIVDGRIAREIYYFGPNYEEIFDYDLDSDSEVHKQKAYVGNKFIRTYTQYNAKDDFGKKADVQYVHLDHLGSTETLSGGDGKLLESLAFGPFGRARQSNWESLDSVQGTNPDWTEISLEHTNKGFTGHETLASFELIHMGGRIYDPVLGRMLQADPLIQAPYNGQSYNRYSYVWNNPLSATDPSGYAGVALGVAQMESIVFGIGTVGTINSIPTLNIPPANFNSLDGQFDVDFQYGGSSSGGYQAHEQEAPIYEGGPTRSEVEDILITVLPELDQDEFNSSGGYESYDEFDGLYLGSEVVESEISLMFSEGGPEVGPGADLSNLSLSDQVRIQNAANRTNQEITVVGSQVTGKAGLTSDWDYIMSGNSSQRHSAISSIPRGTSGGWVSANGNETGIEVYQSYNPDAKHYDTVNKSEPYITFRPNQ